MGGLPEADSAMALEGQVACCNGLDGVEQRGAGFDVLGNPLRYVCHCELRASATGSRWIARWRGTARTTLAVVSQPTISASGRFARDFKSEIYGFPKHKNQD
jgi:hypothetical protein